MKIREFKLSVITLSLLLALVLSSCGAFKYERADVKDSPINDADKRAKNIAEGRGITGPKLNKSGVFNFATSNPMWRASIEVLDFTPLVSADYGGGILITDWYSDQNSSKDAYKITVVFLSNEIRADGLSVLIYNRTCNEINKCKISKVDSKLSEEIKVAILKKSAMIKEQMPNANSDYKYMK